MSGVGNAMQDIMHKGNEWKHKKKGTIHLDTSGQLG